MNRVLLQSAALALSVFVMSTIAKAQTPCSQILAGGAFDAKDVATDTALAVSVGEWMCKHRNATSGESFGVDIKDLASGYGFGANKDNWQSWSDSMCQSLHFGLGYTSIDRTKIRTASKTLIDGFNQCLSQPGLWFHYVPLKSPTQYGVRLKYNPVSKSKPYAQVRYQGASESGCKVLPKRVYGGESMTMLCSRPLKPSTITIATDVAATQTVIDVPGKPKKPNCETPPLFGSSADETIYAGACERVIEASMNNTFSRGGDCNANEESRIVNVTHGRFAPCSCGDKPFGTCVVSSANCSMRVVLRPGESVRLQLVNTNSHCSNPSSPRALSFRQIASKVPDEEILRAATLQHALIRGDGKQLPPWLR